MRNKERSSGGSERQLPREKRVSELVMLLRVQVQQEFKFSHCVRLPESGISNLSQNSLIANLCEDSCVVLSLARLIFVTSSSGFSTVSDLR